MRKFIAWIFLWRLVWLRDHNGELSLRRAIASPFGGFIAKRHPYGIRTVMLNSDGTVSNGAYVQEWMPANKRAQDIPHITKEKTCSVRELENIYKP